jgi:hypothetical protein
LTKNTKPSIGFNLRFLSINLTLMNAKNLIIENTALEREENTGGDVLI